MAFSQTKTAQGYVPFLAARRGEKPVELETVKKPEALEASENQSKVGNGGDAVFEFDLIAPEELNSYLQKQDPRAARPQGRIGLVELGSCLNEKEGAPHPEPALLFEFAQQSGPLFGTASGVESERAWAYAAHAAMLVCRMQECANKRKPMAVLGATGALRKSVVQKDNGENLFTIIDVAVRPYGEYMALFERLPLVRHAVREDSYEYAFALVVYDEPEKPFVEFIVVALDHELTTAEFSYLLDLFQVDEESEDALREKTELLDVPASWVETGLQMVDATLDDADLQALEALVQVMIVAHLGNVRVDMFHGNQETGYLAFDSYLSWMWYDFSRKLSDVSLGYCEQCGRSFSLVGHRGIDRRYCCAACKTKAKNKRAEEKRNEVRTLFLHEGLTVSEIAKKVDMPGRTGEQAIRKNLSQWVELKHALSDEIAERGFQASPLFVRCVREKLNIKQLLNAALWHQLTQEHHVGSSK